MRARLPVLSIRLLVLATVWLLASATLTLAKDDPAVEPAETTTGTSTEALDETPVSTVLVVPDVRDLPYVFAKGVLEDAGLAWRVEGDVEGYAVNLVGKQSVEPGTKVIDTGAPTLVLRLERNPDYEEVGLPDDSSPYPGTKMQLASEADLAAGGTDEQAADQPAESNESGAEAGATEETEPADEKPVQSTDVEAVAETVTEPSEETGDAGKTDEPASGDSEAETRPPAFSEPGAPPEPLDEMPLPDRAKRLGAWLAEQSSMGPAAWDHYTYQHAWVVAGAGFGWWHGAEALRILIDVDERLQKRFDVGARLEQEARRALAEVLSKAAGP